MHKNKLHIAEYIWKEANKFKKK